MTGRETTGKYVMSGLSLPVTATHAELVAAAQKRFMRCAPGFSDFRLSRPSVDARHRDDVRYAASVMADYTGLPLDAARMQQYGVVRIADPERPELPQAGLRMETRPVVVGFGPAGMFAALVLAEAGLAPIVLERGGTVEERAAAVEAFCRTRVLDENSNIQFGAGGAGTFSDGKLVTRINDGLCRYVLERFVEFGAPDEILYRAKPHIGTDRLRRVVAGIAARIEALGGTVCYHSLVAGLRAMYGRFAGLPGVPHAEYTLSCKVGGRGVYTFCMCPGGEVVAASETGGVVTNGMSRFVRDGRNANAAVAVSVNREDYGGTPHEAIAFQRKLESAAFLAAGGDYSAPAQTVGAFLGTGVTPWGRIAPTYLNGGVTETNLAGIFPEFVSSALGAGLSAFGRKISGFDCPDAILTGPETRTSAPVRILRGEDRCMLSYRNIYPTGGGRRLCRGNYQRGD